MSGLQEQDVPEQGVKGQNSRGFYGELALGRLVTAQGRFTWRTPSENPYILRDDGRKTIKSRYADVAFCY